MATDGPTPCDGPTGRPRPRRRPRSTAPVPRRPWAGAGCSPRGQRRCSSRWAISSGTGGSRSTSSTAPRAPPGRGWGCPTAAARRSSSPPTTPRRRSWCPRHLRTVFPRPCSLSSRRAPGAPALRSGCPRTPSGPARTPRPTPPPPPGGGPTPGGTRAGCWTRRRDGRRRAWRSDRAGPGPPGPPVRREPLVMWLDGPHGRHRVVHDRRGGPVRALVAPVDDAELAADLHRVISGAPPLPPGRSAA